MNKNKVPHVLAHLGRCVCTPSNERGALVGRNLGARDLPGSYVVRSSESMVSVLSVAIAMLCVCEVFSQIVI